MHLEIPISAACFSAGAVFGLIYILDELRLQLFSTASALGLTGASICLGIVLGLLLPHRIITPHLNKASNCDASGGAVGQRIEFAAALTGGVLVIFGLLSALLVGGALFMESCRGWLVARFVHPPGLTLTLLCLPLAFGLILAGTGVSLLLVLMHGWRRVAHQPAPRLTGLWTALMIGALCAGVGGVYSSTPLLPAILAPLSVFLAGLLSVARDSRAVGVSPIPSVWRRPSRDEQVMLGAAGLATTAVAASIFLSLAEYPLTPAAVSSCIIVLAGAALTGMAAARLLFRHGPSPACLLACSIAILLPYRCLPTEAFNSALARVFLTTAAGAAYLSATACRMGRPSQNIQRSLSWIVGVAAVFAGAVFAITAADTNSVSRASFIMVVSIVGTASAALMSILDNRAFGLQQALILAAAGVWLFLTPSARQVLSSAQDANPPPTPHLTRLAQEARRLVSADSFHYAGVRIPSADGADHQSWRFDLDGPALDLILIERFDRSPNEAPSVRDCRRLLKRLSTRLAGGGRLLLETPTADGLLTALEEWDAECHRLTLRDEYDAFEALAWGADIPRLVERNRLTCPAAVSLERVHKPFRE